MVDILAALIQQPDYQTARKYWNKLKERLKKEGSESVTNCHQLKLEAADGKKYLTDVANPRTLLAELYLPLYLPGTFNGTFKTKEDWEESEFQEYSVRQLYLPGTFKTN